MKEEAAYPPPSRLQQFKADEKRQDWLTPLLDGYYQADQGVHEGIRRETAQGRRLACSKGCAACCRSHLTIPVYPLELVGIYWYVIEKTTGAVREQLKNQLAEFEPDTACPFLVNDSCAIHPLRPMACRQFNVFGKVCEEGEDAYHTRRQDVLVPIQRYADDAFFTMLPFYGVKAKGERRKLIKQGAHHRLAKVLQEQEWPKLAQRMREYDRRNEKDNGG